MVDNTRSITPPSEQLVEVYYKEVDWKEEHAFAERKLKQKLDLRIILPSFLIYLCCYFGHINVSNARILNHTTNDSLNDTIRFKDNEYHITLMAFLLGYALFEAPSNMLLKKFRPSRWIALLTFSSGAIIMSMAAVHTYPALAGTFTLLGVFESGLFPGLVYVLTFWYKPSEQASRIAFITAASKLSGAVGGMIAYGVGEMNGLCGLEGWRWLFLLEGIPCCLLGVLAFFFFPDFPETVNWLSGMERELAVARLQGVASQGHVKVTKEQILQTLMDWRLYAHYLIYSCTSIAASTLFLFSPSIVNGLGFKDLKAQLFTAPPYALSFVLSILVSLSADRFQARSLHAFVSMLIASASFLVQGLIPNHALIPRYVLLCVAASATFSSIPVLIAWLSSNSRGTVASGIAIALNLSSGAVGQIVGAWIYKDSEAPGYITGHLTNFAMLFVGSILVLALRVVYIRRNAKLTAGSRPWGL